jgi:hypothetical protein
MNGTVTISLSDYELLKNQSSAGKQTASDVVKAAKEIEVFLTFLVTRENIEEHVNEFNSYSKTCKIEIIGGRAKIKFIDKTTFENEED